MTLGLIGLALFGDPFSTDGVLFLASLAFLVIVAWLYERRKP